jgi:hypothetical protein
MRQSEHRRREDRSSKRLMQSEQVFIAVRENARLGYANAQ